MGRMAHADAVEATDAGTPVSIEAALRRVRYLACILVAVRLQTASTLSLPMIVLLVGIFALINVLSLFAQRCGPLGRTVLGVAQLVADTTIVLIVVWVQHGTSDSADWALLVLPVIEGAIRFQIPGAVAGLMCKGDSGDVFKNPRQNQREADKIHRHGVLTEHR